MCDRSVLRRNERERAERPDIMATELMPVCDLSSVYKGCDHGVVAQATGAASAAATSGSLSITQQKSIRDGGNDEQHSRENPLTHRLICAP